MGTTKTAKQRNKKMRYSRKAVLNMRGKAKIKEVTDEYILFTNDARITFDHYEECCEWNYADFEQLDDIARQTTFQFPLLFERIDGSGFRFGNYPNKMFFVPCYTEQNGYYTSELDIYLNGIEVLNLECEFIDC